MKIETETREYYHCSYCDWAFGDPELCREHECDCSLNPANRDLIRSYKGKCFKSIGGGYLKILSAEPGAIEYISITNTREDCATVEIRTVRDLGRALAWAHECDAEEARLNAEHVMDLVRKFLEGARCRADYKTGNSAYSPTRSIMTAANVRISPRWTRMR